MDQPSQRAVEALTTAVFSPVRPSSAPAVTVIPVRALRKAASLIPTAPMWSVPPM
ncbi:hypothetical protein [Kitasatospora sp. NPDC085464]|uniref:hypothetical protein n=1 Tax=Kitasatospora sp. NPDC085464 TaxID=3364063 RepID=UPI0037C869C2